MENREKGLPTPDPHVDGGTGVKTIVYNTKKDSKGRRKKKEERERVKKYNSKKEEFSTLSHSTRTGRRILLTCVRM